MVQISGSLESCYSLGTVLEGLIMQQACIGGIDNGTKRAAVIRELQSFLSNAAGSETHVTVQGRAAVVRKLHCSLTVLQVVR